MLVLFWKFAKFTNFKFGPKNLRKFLCLRKFDVLVNLLIKQTQGNLTRTQMMIDAIPTTEGVEHLAECLLAEFDQLSYAKKRAGGGPALKVKKLEGQEEKLGTPKKPEEDKKVAPCKFFLTEDGCRKGKSCRWSHDMKDPQDLKRCYVCGSTKHYSNKCPTKVPSPPKVAKAEKESEGRARKQTEEDVVSTKATGPGEDMKSLLEEASKMLKAMPSSGTEEVSSEDGDARIRSLQKQLDELRGGQLRVLRLARVQPCEEELGLLDSGATHALRPRLKGECIKTYHKVKINLAGGKQVVMTMSPGKVIVGDDTVEPIVPLGLVVGKLGCTLQWTEDHLLINHPEWGQLPTVLKDGCPMVTKEVALALIKALEAEEIGGLMKASVTEEPLMQWMERVVKEHPAFDGVPEELKRQLLVKPKDGCLSGNRRLRKLWKKEGGVILYLFSGKNEGFTMRRAVKDLGGDRRKVIQVDIQDGEKWNMVEGELYAELLHRVIQGQIDAILASPNCRTRSRLRHREVPGVNLPGPSRRWGEEEWGNKDLSEAERRKCFEDDVMMLRSWMVYIVAEECRKADQSRKKVGFLLEHPAEPQDLPETVSIWRTRQWKAFAKSYKLHEVTVDQAVLGGESKPTTLGCNYDLYFPDKALKASKPQCWIGKTADQLVQESKRLARWTPLLTNAIAEAVLRSQQVQIKVRSWRTHILQNHVPYRKDCLVCQQAAARGRPHYRQALPARAGVLSIDLAGPLEQAVDIGKHLAKYMLVASFTWPKVGTQPDYGDEAPHDEDLGPELPEGKDEEAEEVKIKAMKSDGEGEGSEEQEGKEDWIPTNPQEVEYSPTEPGPDEPEEEERKEVEIVVHRMVLPLPSGSGEDLVRGVSEMYLTLRQEGMFVQQIHSDRGGGFAGSKLAKWCLERGILQTFTAGVDPQANGRAEKSVHVTKDAVRRILKGANATTDMWPLATRCLNEIWRKTRLGLKDVHPPFLARVLIRKRYWKTQELEARNEAVRYVCPSWQSHGHLILRPNGTLEVTRAVIAEAQVPILDAAWIALEDVLDPLEVRRRIRGKMQVRRLKEETEEERKVRKERETLI